MTLNPPKIVSMYFNFKCLIITFIFAFFFFRDNSTLFFVVMLSIKLVLNLEKKSVNPSFKVTKKGKRKRVSDDQSGWAEGLTELSHWQLSLNSHIPQEIEKFRNPYRMHHALNARASSDPTLAISDHWRELKALQTHNVTPIWEELIGEPPNAPVRPLHFSTFSLLRPEVSFANPSSIRFAAATWPSRCVCLIIPLLQHQNMPGMPMTLRSYPGNDPTYRLRNMSKLFCYQRLKQLLLSPANFKRCVLGLRVHESGLKK